MAADNTAERTATGTLTAATAYVFNLTASLNSFIDLVHHGDDTDVVYWQVESTEARLQALGLAADGHPVLLPGERLTVPVPRNGCWVRLLSAGTPTVTVDGDL